MAEMKLAMRSPNWTTSSVRPLKPSIVPSIASRPASSLALACSDSSRASSVESDTRAWSLISRVVTSSSWSSIFRCSLIRSPTPFTYPTTSLHSIDSEPHSRATARIASSVTSSIPAVAIDEPRISTFDTRRYSERPTASLTTLGFIVLRTTSKRSIVAVGEFEIAPAPALDPQGHKDVLHRDPLVAKLHAVSGKRRRLVAGKGHPRLIVDHDPAVAAVLVVPHRIGAL